LAAVERVADADQVAGGREPRLHLTCPHFNAIRLHSSLNYLTPLEFKQQHHPFRNRAILQE
jgi:hypothetical protein